ncbi:multiple C2 and transmembrane domain-containing protein 2 isoform 2-T6 [Clarias gariepinus]|nr:multiple C2 and transmembrane domain-containing protein 2 isoform X2 [Clarias gariepinus]XP_053357008.1 multiple C2 and transmembrane domain-containing protein 2 isoform X2 [Clarias gariepinus]XP_053357009.1 multiple C2 and transmembrane domain-containing protein 2 isoform X2 [Clarias gariepinus]
MDPKKNKVLSKLGDKTRQLFNVKAGKKHKKTPLKYRRSISVPDLLSDRSSPSLLDPTIQSSFPDSFVGPGHSLGPGEAKCETASLTDSITVPDATTETSLDQTITTNTSSAKPPDQITATYTPTSAKVTDNLVLSNTPPTIICSASERPAFINVSGTKDKTDKRMEEKERNTTWYIEDSESACSTPSEDRSYCFWPPDHDLAGSEPITPRSTEMFIIGSAEDKNEGSNETNDYDTSFSGREMKSSGVSSEPQATAAGQKLHYLLTINLKEGRNLAIKDRSGTSDPYVKFKIDAKTVYKSKVVYKNLNPVWNECFSILIRDLDQKVYAKVYDRDLRSRDFMGLSAINLSNLEIDKTSEIILRLKDPGSLEEDMGVIILDACVSICEGPTKRNKWQLKRKGSFNKGQHRAAAMQKSQVWSGVYTVVLVEGQDMPEGGQGDIFVRFKLAEQRFRSKNLCIKTNPQWRERFEFNRFEDGQPDVLLVDVCCKKGRKCEECWGVIELDLSQLPANTTQTYNVIAGKGRLVFLVTLNPCSGVSISDLGSTSLDNPYTYETILKNYSLKNTLDNIKDVGYLQVKVLRATDLPSTDLNGKSDPFCVLELGNSKLQTQTIYKTLNPEWRTAFTLPIKDIHDVLMLTVFGEDGDKAPDFLGKVAIPLLAVSNGQQITSLLKKDNLADVSKGSITMELNVFYNPVRAAFRTFHPKETKLEEDNPKFNKKLLARNIYRVRRISMAILYTLQYIKSCFQWESTQRSIIAFLVFVLTVWQFELFMLPLFLLLLIGWNYFHITPGAGSHSQDLESLSAAEEEDEDEKESEKRGLMEKIHMVQEIVLTVQSVLDEIACIGERVKNTFNWSVPFMSFLACFVLFIATATLYYIPLRYIVLLWGANKFTKKLRNPHAIETNEILDFLRRVPSDVQKVQYTELRAPGIQSAQKKKR